METKDDYTQDGTVDFRGKPAVPSKTGKWKACAFLVGKTIQTCIFCVQASLRLCIIVNIWSYI